MVLWTEGNVPLPDGHLHYYRTGGQKLPLILVHGFTESGMCWTSLAQALESEYDIIMPDLRGHGSSSAFQPNSYTIQTLAKDLVKTIQHLGLLRPVLIGHSIGARAAAFLAANFPPLVKGLVLEDPEWQATLLSRTPAERTAQVFEMEKNIRAWKGQTAPQIIAEYRRGNAVSWNRLEYTPWVEAKQSVNPFAAYLLKADSEPLALMIPAITCPTLILTGDPQEGAAMDAKTAQQIASPNPNIKTLHIDGAGHNIRRDKFEPYLQAVRDFLYGLGG